MAPSLSHGNETLQRVLREHCAGCHNEDVREAGVRLDTIDPAFGDGSLKLWEAIQKQVASKSMPPEEEPPLAEADREAFLKEVASSLHHARTRELEFHGSVRRLTVAQYRNALRELLGIDEDLTKILPPDAVSKDGFTNNAQTLSMSPLLIESYFQIAEQAVDAALVREDSIPSIHNFRMELGQGINREPCPDTLILGANNLLLRSEDFVVTEPELTKPFTFTPFFMQRKFRFIEGYQGNDTVRGWRDFDSIYHAVFACMRGSEGYPKGLAYETVPEGLLLRPAIPSSEIFGESNTYGPHANFKISLRELPDRGQFRIRVRAAKYEDGLLIGPNIVNDTDLGEPDYKLPLQGNDSHVVMIREPGIYRIDTRSNVPDGAKDLRLRLGKRFFSGKAETGPFLAVRLPAGPLEVQAVSTPVDAIERLSWTKIDEGSPLGKEFLAFESRCPEIGVHVGLRRDCGSTMNPVGTPKRVSSTDLQEFVFEDAISNYPSPDVEPNNVNYLAGIREIGIRSEYTDARDMPRLLIERVEFEGPYLEAWPPPSHRRIMDSANDRSQPDAYASDVLLRFAERAYRRPITTEEQAELLEFWRQSLNEVGDLQESIRRGLIFVLTSPQFLFLSEASHTAQAESLTSWELASKLSFFLWNSPPDEELRSLAAQGRLLEDLDSQVDRLIDDPRFERFAETFVSEWLSLDKLQIVETDAKRFPRLTRDVKAALRWEPIRFFEYAIRNNLPLHSIIRSEVLVVNDVVADYYGFGDSVETGFAFVAIPSPDPRLGGLLSRAAVMAGLSDGRESNPVKRGAWFARRMIAKPPEDPPPNVPKLEDLTELSLRERLERHRNVKGCVQCHTGIDPWGLPFEAFDAGGLRKNEPADDATQLPDGTTLANFADFQEHLSTTMMPDVAASLMHHLTAYAIGRSLTYNEAYRLRESLSTIDPSEFKLRDVVHRIVQSDLFLKK
ncbi:MAG: DUF1592 domain-containing protein [Pirellula sp.]|nr:DUF1592 domain-containing protein [Pirellula sp.]